MSVTQVEILDEKMNLYREGDSSSEGSALPNAEISSASPPRKRDISTSSKDAPTLTPITRHGMNVYQPRAERDVNARKRRVDRMWPANEGHGGAMTLVAAHTHRAATEPQSAMSLAYC